MASWTTLLCLCCASTVLCQSPMRIGGIFDDNTEDQETAFKMAVNDVNQQRMFYPSHKLRASTETVEAGNSLAAAEGVCRLIQTGIFGIFGPFSSSTSHTVQSICDTLDIPHLEARWDSNQQRGSCLINLHPHPPTMAKVFMDLVKEWKWKSFTILYETRAYLPRVAELLKMYGPRGYTVTMRQLDIGVNDNNYRQIFRLVKKSTDRNLILDCSIESLPQVLDQAQQVGIISDQFQIIITNLDMQTIDLEPFSHSGTNITGVRLFDSSGSYIQDVTESWATYETRKGRNISEGLTASKLRVETALMYDAVQLFAAALNELNITGQDTNSVDCGLGGGSWGHGWSLINVMKTSSISGLTRSIKFDNEGFRSDFLLDILELSPEGLSKIGEWNHEVKITKPSNVTELDIDHVSMLKNVTLRVLIAISEPYNMLKRTSSPLSGNDRFEGFGIELIDELSKSLGFNYVFVLHNGSDYGSMLQKVVSHKSDLAITDLTVTAERQKVVDFTSPFMNLGIMILYKVPEVEDPGVFAFMGPFSGEVWIWLGISYVSVSVLLFILGRLSPAEWRNPFACIEDPELLHNQFDITNSCWFNVGSLMQQGSEVEPTSASTRVVFSIWWFFILIMVSSYMATLASVLTVKQPIEKITNVEDLAWQSEIKYGAKKGGATYGFFEGSDTETYKKMYQFMKENPEYMTETNEEGVHRVKTENYAFLMESTSIEYTIQRECMLDKVGNTLDDKGYGIAMRQNTPYRHELSSAVLKLQESGKLDSMKLKWWQEKRGGGACSSSEPEATEKLTMKNFAGVFLLTIVGCVMGLGINVTECIRAVFRRKKLLKVSFWKEFVTEMKFFADCSAETKPVQYAEESPVTSTRSRSKMSPFSGNSSNVRKRSIKSPSLYSYKNSMKSKKNSNT